MSDDFMLDDAALTALDPYVPPLRGLGRIGLLGGSFNPPHLGHLLIAAAVYAVEEIDHLWVLPTASHAFGKELAPFADRVRMCHLAFRHLAGGAAVLDLEERLPKPSYTVNLLRALHALRPGIKPVWIAGSDVLAELPRWREPEVVQTLARFVVVPRKGYEGGARLGIELPMLSSTDVRTARRRGESIEGLVDREVLAYVDRRDLYRSP
jgi:nicotinate-nucleotide adenylyltransferase